MSQYDSGVRKLLNPGQGQVGQGGEDSAGGGEMSTTGSGLNLYHKNPEKRLNR